MVTPEPPLQGEGRVSSLLFSEAVYAYGEVPHLLELILVNFGILSMNFFIALLHLSYHLQIH